MEEKKIPFTIIPPTPRPNNTQGKREPSVNKKILDDNADVILEMIAEGRPFKDVCAKYDVPMSTFLYWRKHSAYSEQVTEAIELSAHMDVEKAYDVLSEELHPKDMANAQMKRSLADFLKWRASKKLPKIYGNQPEEKPADMSGKLLSDEQFAALLTKVAVTPQITEEHTEEKDKNDDIEEAHIIS